MESKTLNLEFKTGEGEEGQFRALFSRYDVVDLDGDVTLKGAFPDGEPVMIAKYSHDWTNPPIGRGVIDAKGDDGARVDGEFFLDTTVGLDTYRVVKRLGELQQYSYGYDVLDSEFGTFQGQKVRFLKALKVHEVSPVFLGAGIGTGTESIKGSLAQEVERYTADLGAWVNRAKARADMRGKEGRTLSAANRDLLKRAHETIGGILEDLAKLLADTDPASDEPKGINVLADFIAYQAIEARINGVKSA